ncbi:hypothetical protein BO82DRAFT_436379 [Aspergillus uvarum CBS 121591]|uniref:Transcription factor domain-containing protein n=1 Tax=Aspergillus uvarum CBS 121591 TaxID=1448315 RepID=A0A319CE00_9EURO|nr:hypothetical protein BO82DRAFT_436379 [Aspergillus uvarum CBS 121591]PYH76783.1 hypothetical protein BO82DRAFT_436379 [Aspergillus uvarum CBS 121591]
MSLMPDHASLWKDSLLLAIEVPALASLYLYSIDQRESAHIDLGQAIRIAKYEGLHTQLSEEQLESETVARCRGLWWTLAGYAHEMEEIIQIRLRNSLNTMPRGTQHITLLYHQCVIVATRPLLLSALIDRLDTNDFLTLTKPLLCIEILQAPTVFSITPQNLEVLLLYDLEFTYDAAIHLALTRTLFRNSSPLPTTQEGNSPSPSPSQQAHSILDAMIYHGNRIAHARKEGLVHLERLLEEVAVLMFPAGIMQGGDDYSTTAAAGGLVGYGDGVAGEEELSGPSLAAMGDPQLANVEFLEQIGISSVEFLSIVAQIGPLDGAEGGFGGE